MQQLIINDLDAIMVSIIIAGIFSCIILDILGYLQKMIGIPEPSWNILGRWGYYMIKNGILFNPKIHEIFVKNREDCCKDRADGLTIILAEDKMGENITAQGVFKGTKDTYKFKIVSI